MFKGLSQTPPAGPRGHMLTLWLLDRGRFWGLLRAQQGDDSWDTGLYSSLLHCHPVPQG